MLYIEGDFVAKHVLGYKEALNNLESLYSSGVADLAKAIHVFWDSSESRGAWIYILLDKDKPKLTENLISIGYQTTDYREVMRILFISIHQGAYNTVIGKAMPVDLERLKIAVENGEHVTEKNQLGRCDSVV